MKIDKKVDVAIIGAGTAGLNALSQVRKAGKSFVFINGGHLGTTCARVGCMPSKAFIQIADDFHRRAVFERHGIQGEDALTIDMPEALEHVRELRDTFVDRVTANSTDHMGEELIDGYAEFLESGVIRVNDDTIQADSIVIATGSTPVIPNDWKQFEDLILTSDNLFEQEKLPDSIAVIGLGVIGLELGQSLHRYGVSVTGIDQLQTLAGLTDPEVSKVALETLSREFPIWLGHSANIERENDQLRVSAGDNSVLVDKILVSMGRKPNMQTLRLDRLGIHTNDNGVPDFNPNTMQVDELPVFIAGDNTGTRPILHEAGDEGKIAGYNASHDNIVAFKRKTPLAITFCDPNIAQIGASWAQLKDRSDIAIGEIRMGPVGRALIMAQNRGIIRVYAEKPGGKILGAALISVRGEHIAHLLAWSVQQGLTVFDLLKMPYYHPVIEEALQGCLNSITGELEQPDLPIRELDLLD